MYAPRLRSMDKDISATDINSIRFKKELLRALGDDFFFDHHGRDVYIAHNKETCDALAETAHIQVTDLEATKKLKQD